MSLTRVWPPLPVPEISTILSSLGSQMVGPSGSTPSPTAIIIDGFALLSCPRINLKWFPFHLNLPFDGTVFRGLVHKGIDCLVQPLLAHVTPGSREIRINQDFDDRYHILQIPRVTGSSLITWFHSLHRFFVNVCMEQKMIEFRRRQFFDGKISKISKVYSYFQYLCFIIFHYSVFDGHRTFHNSILW